jgi:hypothetical protein
MWRFTVAMQSGGYPVPGFPPPINIVWSVNWSANTCWHSKIFQVPCKLFPFCSLKQVFTISMLAGLETLKISGYPASYNWEPPLLPRETSYTPAFLPLPFVIQNLIPHHCPRLLLTVEKELLENWRIAHTPVGRYQSVEDILQEAREASAVIDGPQIAFI